MITLFVLLLLAPQSAELHVAPRGSDSNPGTLERPFATLEGARDALRARGGAPEGGATIWVADGHYARVDSFHLESRDSGRPGAPITYRARTDRTASLHGGLLLPAGRFRKVSREAILQRVDRRARGALVTIDLRDLGLEELPPLQARGFPHPVRPAPPELFWNGMPLTLARWPDEGFAKITAVHDPGSSPRAGETPDRAPVFSIAGERPRRWLGEPDPWLFGYWFHDWADESIPLASIDPEHLTLHLARPHRYAIRSGQPFYAENMLCELDRAGEYYLDRESCVLYLWPPGPLEDARIELSTLGAPLVVLEEVSQVVLRGFDLRLARGDGIRIRGGAGVTIAACALSRLGNRAIEIDGGEQHRVLACDIELTGEGGIALNGGDRHTLTPSGHVAHNNHIHHFSRRVLTYRPAISLDGVGNRATHNLIHDGPHAAILFGGNDHLIEANEIHHVLTATGDGGAVYCGRDWSARGHVIRRNWFHHLVGLRKWENAVYLDDQASGIRVEENVFSDCHWGMLVGGGRHNLIARNLFVDCTLAIHLDARGLGWAERLRPTLEERLAQVPYRGLPWSRRYPELIDILAQRPMAPVGNALLQNLLVRSGRIDQDLHAEARRLGRLEDNRELDTVPGDGELPIQGIGLVRDELRPALPRRGE